MMKKTIALILMLLIVCTAAVSLASKPGDIVSVTLTISGAGESFGVVVNYPSELVFVSASAGSIKDGFASAGPNRWGGICSSGDIGSASATYRFRIADDAKPGTYYVSGSIEEGTGSVSGGSVTVEGEVHTHTPGSPVKENEVPATCEKAGSYDEVIYCTVCKEEISRTKKTTPKLDHTPGTPVKENEVAATCEKAGSYDEVIYCTVCEKEISRTTKTTPKLDHTPMTIPGKAPTCEEDGLTEGKVCSVCGMILVKQEKIPATGHTEVVVPGKPATCEEDGLTEGKKCSVCGKILVEQEKIPATGHTEVVVPGKPATCGEDGLTDGVVCAVCGKVLVEQEVIPAALAHEPVVIPGKPATCEEEGLTEGEICAICGTVLKEQEVIPALGHEIVTVPGKAPTCTKTGLTEGEKCAVCGKVIKAQTVIPALGHNWKKQEPTSLLRTEYICRRCGMRHYTNEKNSIRNYYGSILINANGKYVDYIASVDPKNDAGLVITAVIKPTAPDWTSEIGLYLTKDLIKQIKGDGFEYITYVNDSAALTFVLNGIDETMFETAEAINQYAFITDPKAENGCLVKVEGVTETGRVSAAEFAPMELVIKGQKIKVTKEGNYKPE